MEVIDSVKQLEPTEVRIPLSGAHHKAYMRARLDGDPGLLVMVSHRSASGVVLAVEASRGKPILAVMSAWPLEAREWRSNAFVLIPIRAPWC